MVIHQRTLLFGVIALGLLIAACTTPQQAKQRAAEAQQELPLPPKATLLAETLRDGSGSQDNCVGAITVQVFGSQQAFDEVLDFYHTNLIQAGWAPAENTIVAGFTKADDKLSINLIQLDPNTGGIYISHTIQPTLAAQQNDFRTFFEVDMFFSTCP